MDRFSDDQLRRMHFFYNVILLGWTIKRLSSDGKPQYQISNQNRQETIMPKSIPPIDQQTVMLKMSQPLEYPWCLDTDTFIQTIPKELFF